MTKFESAIRDPRSAILWVVFAAFVLFVYFSGLTVPLMGPDEPRYAEVAREMLERGDWLTPTLGGHPWFEKPPLLYWLEIVSFSLLGVSEFAARLGPALCGLGTVIALWILGKTEHQSQGARFADHLAIIAASTFGIIVFSHAAGFDIVLAFPLTVALAGFLAFERSSGRSKLPLLGFFVFVAVAVLAKGLIGFIFPFAIIGLYYLLSRRRPPRQFFIGMAWGLPLMLLIAAPWHVAMYIRHGSEFVDVYFIQNHFERFTTNKYLHPQPFYFFFLVLPVMMLPWLPFFFIAAWSAGRDIVRGIAPPILLFAISWLAVPLVFFSFSGSKLPGYIVPAIPAAVIITGLFTFELDRKSRAWRSVIVATAIVALAVVGVVLASKLPGFAEADSVKTLIQGADERGHASSRVLTLHMISYNAEFYAAGRLLRDESGGQRRLEGATQVLAEAKKERGRTVLVLVPVEYVYQLTDYDKVTSDVIKDNGEVAIVAVSAK